VYFVLAGSTLLGSALCLTLLHIFHELLHGSQ
jgi:hypothetical protein